MNFRVDLKTITDSYIIDGLTYDAGATYDYKVCKIIEDYCVKLMNKEDILCEWSYLIFGVGPKRIHGVMTITFVEHFGVPEVFTFVYEKENTEDEEL